MRPVCFSPLITDRVNTYDEVICIDQQLEKYLYKNVSDLRETEDGYKFLHGPYKIFWTHTNLVRVEFGSIVSK